MTGSVINAKIIMLKDIIYNNSSLNIRDWEMEIKVLGDANERVRVLS
jgi:hypothetical protein